MAFAKYPVGGGGGSGDVTGPVSSVNNGLVLWDGTSGNVIKDAGVGSNGHVLRSNGTTPSFGFIEPANIASPNLLVTNGSQTWDGLKTFSTGARFSASSNQLDFGPGPNRITINVPTPSGPLTYSVPNNITDGSGNATFAMREANNTWLLTQTFNVDAFFLGQVYIGVNPNRVVLDPGSRASTATWFFPNTTGTNTFAALENTQTFIGNKTFSGTLTIPSSITIGANTFARSGAHGLTLTTTGTTNVTLPTTGTIATLGGSETLTNKSLTSPTLTGTPVLPSTFTIGANSFIRSGAHNLTLTTGGATNVTLPTTGTLATLAGSETLTNKTITAPILNTHADYANISTPATPGAGVLRVYSKSDDRLYRVNSSGLEVAIGGGLDPVERSTTLNPAVAGTLYLCNTSSAGFTITLPTGTAKASIGFLDARETWGTNNLTIAPATGQQIDGQAVNETLVCDVSGSWVILTWSASDSRWIIQSSAPGSSNQAIVQGGNTLGAAMTIGTNDNFGLNLETNGTTKLTVGTDSSLYMTGAGSSFTGPSGYPYIGSKQSNVILSNAGNTGAFMCNGLYFDGTNWRHSTSVTAGALFQTLGNTASGNNAFAFYSTNSFGHAADATATLTTIVSATHAGAVTLGPAAGGVTHRLNINTSTTATSGATSTLPAQARGYITININGTDRKIPYYDV